MREMSRTELREVLAGGVALDGVEDDARTVGVGVEGTDRDEDGRIAGREEVDALAAMLDELDGRRDGRVTAVRRDGTATPVAPVLDAIGERGDVDALRALAQAGDPRQAIAFVAMTESSMGEAAALRRRVPVLLAGDRLDGADVVRGADGRAHDLASALGRARFVASLALPADVAGAVEGVIRGATARSRRELAMLAAAWAPAYRGEPIPERLVVSGHGTGETFFETDDDELAAADVIALARAMAVAAGEVRSIHLAACQHGYETRMARWREAFPALESMWGYAAFSPTRGVAEQHEAVWERRTRDDGGQLRREEVLGTRRAAGVAVWTREGGWTGPDQRPLREIGAELRPRLRELERWFRGEHEPEDPGRGFLADTYGLLQELTSHLDFADQRDVYRDRYGSALETCLRLRFFRTHVAPRFERAHRRELERGYASIGLVVGAFAGMTRSAAMREIERFDAALRRREPPPAAAQHIARLLHDGLRDLSPRLVPRTWL